MGLEFRNWQVRLPMIYGPGSLVVCHDETACCIEVWQAMHAEYRIAPPRDEQSDGRTSSS